MCFDDPPSVDIDKTDQGTKNCPSSQSSRVRIISVRPLRKPASEQVPPNLDDYQSEHHDDSDVHDILGIHRMQKKT